VVDARVSVLGEGAVGEAPRRRRRVDGAYLLKLVTVVVGIVDGAVVDEVSEGTWPLPSMVVIIVGVVAAWAL